LPWPAVIRHLLVIWECFCYRFDALFWVLRHFLWLSILLLLLFMCKTILKHMKTVMQCVEKSQKDKLFSFESISYRNRHFNLVSEIISKSYMVGHFQSNFPWEGIGLPFLGWPKSKKMTSKRTLKLWVKLFFYRYAWLSSEGKIDVF